MISLKRIGEMAVEPVMTGIQLISTPPTAPVSVTATARSLGILVQWSKVSGADGYNILISTDGNMAAPATQASVPGENTVEYFYNTGHTGIKRFFAVQSYKGTRYSAYSTVVSATTTQAGSSSSFPVDATFNNVETTIATVTLTTTGGTLLVMGEAIMSQNGGNRAVTMRLKEDGAIIRTVTGVARDNTSTNGYQLVAFNFSTPVAGAHTYIVTAQNTSSADTCTASGIGLLVAEIPLLAVAAPPASQTPAQAPVEPTTYPSGPDQPPFRW